MFACVRMQSIAAVLINLFYGKPIVNANLTISTNNGARHAALSSSLAGKGASVMPAAVAAWVGVRDLQYRSLFDADRTAGLFGTGISGNEQPISIRRFSKPRVANA